MLAFPEMIVDAANQAGIKVPPNINNYNAKEYVKWHIFCATQLGSPMPSPGCHYENAKVIAELTEEEAKTITFPQLEEKGFQIGYNRYRL